ncbi:hypothetical protein GCM10010518_18220 [Kitasatospora cinereorecta]
MSLMIVVYDEPKLPGKFPIGVCGSAFGRRDPELPCRAMERLDTFAISHRGRSVEQLAWQSARDGVNAFRMCRR